MVVLLLLAITVSTLLGNTVDGGNHPKPQHSLCEHIILSASYQCSQHMIQTKNGSLLGLQRVSSSSSSLRLGNDGERGPPLLFLHGLFMDEAGDAWFENTRQKSLGFILADHGFDVWVGNVRGTRWSHVPISLLEKNKELALYDLSEMIKYINSVTNSKLFVLEHSQETILSFAAFKHSEIIGKVEGATLLSPIPSLDTV
ncbi:triacylglycerol lipase 1-like [Abrus precatorius]|uniref:Triacylglycerol lipase 1-like n=1 Tax=Abrus precatorius TaxID=3816 RepID=A0A8B8MAD1_ABRPR|nr:triacylglycerol lipase 1-like [Abrus precatorius]